MTDIDPRAVAATRRYAWLNGVEIDVRIKGIFAGYESTFDIILANLPNEIVAPSHHSDLPSEDVRTFDGGKSARLLDLEELPAKSFVTDNLSFYQSLDEAGIIKIFRNPE